MKHSALIFSLLLLPLLIISNLLCGSVDLSFSDVIQSLLGEDKGVASFIVIQSRLPQMLTAILSGSALAVSGLILQTIFSNPLADPSILGVSSGAGLGAAIAMLLFGGSFTAGYFTLSGYLLTVFFAFIGAMLVIFLLLACSSLLRDNILLLVTGVMISFAVSSFISILSFFSTSEGVHSYVIWGMGNFSGVTLQRLPIFSLLVVPTLIWTLLMVKPLNALLLGHEYATNLGFQVTHVRSLLLLLTGILTASVTALCGPIAFIGLAVPHIARLFATTANHRKLLPLTLLWGANISLLCNLLANIPGDRGQLPLNAITPLLGVPVVLYLLFRHRGI